jgi:hypothetical protein
MLGLDQPAFTEGWRPIKREVLPALGSLAEHQELRLREAADEIQQPLSG